MFDARSLLEQLMRGGGGPQPQQAMAPGQGGGGLGDILGQLTKAMGQQGGQSGASQGGGGLGDILGQLTKAMGQGGGQQGGGQPAPSAPDQGLPGGLGDILGQLGKAMGQGGGQQGGAQPQGMPPYREQRQTRDDDAAQDADQDATQARPQGGGLPGGLGDILGKLGGGQGGPGGGGLTDILGQIFGQATQGVREGAGRVDEATGATTQLRDMLAKATGKSPDEVMAQLRELAANNQLGAGALAGGLGAVLLGTKTGRSLATHAAKLGGLVLIGGLAYKALQNYQAGRPLVASPAAAPPPSAPQGSGFESGAITHDSALLYIRAMIAAAAADGRIDAGEQQRILGGIKQAGMDAGAEEFLANELNNPASPEELARGVKNDAEAVQLYTAARVAIDLHTAEEHEFLVALAAALGIDEKLAAHIDAEARAAA